MPVHHGRAMAQPRRSIRAGGALPLDVVAPGEVLNRPETPTASRGATAAPVVLNRIGIAAEPSTVFRYVTDLAHEPDWNPKLLEVTRLSSGPPGVGDRYRLLLRGTGWMTTEVTRYEPPHAWSSRGVSASLTVESSGRVGTTGSGCELVIETHLLPHGLLRLAAPVLRLVVHRHWDENLRRIKALLENKVGVSTQLRSGAPDGLADVRARPRRPWTPARDTVAVLWEYAAEAAYGMLHRRWRDPGACADETTAPLPGDELVDRADWQATRAITIKAPPSQVWPWLAQAGYGRGGWYGDLPWWKDPRGATGPRSSASVLLPEHQHLAAGDVLLDGPNCDESTGAWRVVQVDPLGSLVLRSRRTFSGREVGKDEHRRVPWFDCSWAFVLLPLGADSTRLLVRSRAAFHPSWMVRVAPVLRAGDTVMQRAMLFGLKGRAEGLLYPSPSAVPEPPPTPDSARLARPTSPFSPATRARPAVQRVPVPDLCCLWAETPTSPMHLALAATVDAQPFQTADGSVDVALVRALVTQHLHRTPMLRRVVVRPPIGFGGPFWSEATDFHIDDHVNEIPAEVPLADEDAFWSWCAARSLVPLDRTRPLWRLDLVPGLPGGRMGLLIVVHHVVADGLRGASMLMALLDTEPTAPETPPTPWRPAARPGLATLAADHAMSVIHGRHLASLRSVLRGAQSVRREQQAVAPVTGLTGRIGPGRRVQVLHLPLEQLRSLSHAHGCTINDLLLAAVAAGLHRYLSQRGQCPPDLVLRASVPVGAVHGRSSGMIVVPLPVGVADHAERLRRIAAETAKRKPKADEGVAGIVAMPRLLARLGVLWARQAASSHINLYVTNVPGPSRPLYLHGVPLQTVVPMAPLVAGVRLSVTALSYAGTYAITFLGDRDLGDLAPLADAAGAALHLDAAGR